VKPGERPSARELELLGNIAAAIAEGLRALSPPPP
jgi:hypothetical protein